jgi:HNH endonuclease
MNRWRKPWFPTLEARLIGNSVLDLDTDCWVWIGFRDRKGYGMTTIWINSKRHSRYAHRLSFEVLRGEPIPLGLQIDHTCMNPSCINPDHLQLATLRENTRLRNARRA